MAKFLIGILAGLFWGAAAAGLNAFISKRCVAKAASGVFAWTNILQTLVSLAALAAVVLMRNILPFRYEGMLVGTAISMSMLGIVFAFMIAKQ